MFNCEICKKSVGPGIPTTKLVLKTRIQTYQHFDGKTEEWYSTQGTEIVKEIDVCPDDAMLNRDKQY